MVRDYSERKTVTRNRPKKQPVGLFVIIVTGAVAVSFAAGLFSGWLIFRPKGHAAPAAVAAQNIDQAPPAAASAGDAATAPKAQRGQDPPLTFYETLSKGDSNALIGSGLNPKRLAENAPTKPAAPPSPALPSEPKGEKPAASHVAAEKKPPSAPAAATVPDSDKNAAGAEAVKDATKKTMAKPVRYTVQVASFREKKEADAIVARFVERGLAAYISESKVPDKGVWYRVRIGKHLDQKAAADLAARAGKGAVQIPE